MLVRIIIVLNVALQQACNAQHTACGPWTPAACRIVLYILRNRYFETLWVK